MFLFTYISGYNHCSCYLFLGIVLYYFSNLNLKLWRPSSSRRPNVKSISKYTHANVLGLNWLKLLFLHVKHRGRKDCFSHGFLFSFGIILTNCFQFGWKKSICPSFQFVLIPSSPDTRNVADREGLAREGKQKARQTPIFSSTTTVSLTLCMSAGGWFGSHSRGKINQ